MSPMISLKSGVGIRARSTSKVGASRNPANGLRPTYRAMSAYLTLLKLTSRCLAVGRGWVSACMRATTVKRNNCTQQHLGEITKIEVIPPHQMKNGKLSRWMGLDRIVQQAAELNI